MDDAGHAAERPFAFFDDDLRTLSRRSKDKVRSRRQLDREEIDMTNDQWCRFVLKQFFPNTISDQTQVSPALSKPRRADLAEWQQVSGFSGVVDVAAHKAPYGGPPGFKWVGQVLFTAAWHRFTGEQAIDPWARARIHQKFGPQFRIAIGSGMSVDDL
jgi:hypothetical protein